MGYRTCCVVGCSTTKDKCRGVSFHAIKRRDKEWEKKLVNAVSRQDKSFNPANAVICSRHFTDDCLKSGKKEFERILIDGKVPTLLLAKKVYRPPMKVRPPPKPRHVTVEEWPEAEEQPIHALDHEDVPTAPTFTDWNASFPTMPKGWAFIKSEQVSEAIQVRGERIVARIQVFEENAQQGKLYVGGVLQGHFDVSQNFPDVLCSIEKQYPVCLGIRDPDLLQLHSLSCVSEHWVENGQMTKCLRSKNCGGSGRKNMCVNCRKIRHYLRKRAKQTLKRNSVNKPVSVRGPLQRYGARRLAKALQLQRKLQKKLQKKLAKVSKDIACQAVPVQEKLHESLTNIMEQESESLTSPLCQLFWQQQAKAFKSKGNSHRWHPDIIRLALLLHTQSPSAYRSLRDSGVLCLPGETTLRDYSNYITPQQGFNPQVIEEVKQRTSSLKSNERFVVLMHDEMSISSDLVYSKRTGEIVGTVYGTQDTPAKQVLAFMIRGVNTNLSMCVGYFGTTSAKAPLIYQLFWECVFHLEHTCGLKVVASVSDKAAPNIRFMEVCTGGRTSAPNIFATEERNIFFLSDAPHLVKTLRNNLANSGAGKKSRYMWKEGSHLLWPHVRDLYKTDIKRELRMTKLTESHIYLTSYSKMKVNLAVQTMSASVGNLLKATGGDEVQETAEFLLLVDRVFDCLNTRSEKEAHRRLKPDLLPYTSPDDPRFHFLESTVTTYLDDWRNSIEQREGFLNKEKKKMFLTDVTYKALRTTVQSTPELVKFLLSQGVSQVCTRSLSQDPLEAHFGKQRAAGRRSDNPTLYQFGYNENKIRIQRSVASLIRTRGNTTAEKRKVEVCDVPLKKRKR